MRAREQRKFAKKVDDDEETMSVEDAVPCDQRTIGVVDSGGTGKKRARLKIPNGRKTGGSGKSSRTRQKRTKNKAERLERERQGRRKRLPGSLCNIMMFTFPLLQF